MAKDLIKININPASPGFERIIIESAAGITGGSENDEYVTFKVGSASYSFKISKE